MKNNVPLEGLDDTVTLEQVKSIFGTQRCGMLNDKPKFILLNGWKEGSDSLLYKVDGRIPLSSISSDFLIICCSFDNVSNLQLPLPPSMFPATLCEVILKYKEAPIIALFGLLNGELMKKSKKIIKVKGKSVSINESCTCDTTLQLMLEFSFTER